MTTFVETTLPALFIKEDGKFRRFDLDLISSLNELQLRLKGILDKGVSLDDNIDSAVSTFTSNATPDTEDTVAHTLGKVPTHFIVTSLNKAAVVYIGPTAFTSTNVYLKTNVASTAVKLILL